MSRYLQRTARRMVVEGVFPNDRWCLVHATHISEEELASLCGCGAVCVCVRAPRPIWVTGCSLCSHGSIGEGGLRSVPTARSRSILTKSSAGWSMGNAFQAARESLRQVPTATLAEGCSNRSWREAVSPAVMARDSCAPVRPQIWSPWTTKARCWPVTMRNRCWTRSSSSEPDYRSTVSWSAASGWSWREITWRVRKRDVDSLMLYVTCGLQAAVST